MISKKEKSWNPTRESFDLLLYIETTILYLLYYTKKESLKIVLFAYFKTNCVVQLMPRTHQVDSLKPGYTRNYHCVALVITRMYYSN